VAAVAHFLYSSFTFHRYALQTLTVRSKEVLSSPSTKLDCVPSLQTVCLTSHHLANTNLPLQVNLIPIIRHPTRHQALTAGASLCQDEVADVFDARGAESVGLGVGGDVLLEDEVLRVVEGVDGPVLGFDCEVRDAS
jgi:hypothetical protein